MTQPTPTAAAIHDAPTGPSGPAQPVVGIFDSGVGGLSVLTALRQSLPGAHLVYVADSGYAPYGERGEVWLQGRCVALAGFLRSRQVDLLVMACNTATAAAAPLLRAIHPDWPIVGIEPGIKPAVMQSPRKRVGVMATEATLRSQRYAKLLAEHAIGARVMAQPCTGLAMAIEAGDEPAIRSLIAHHTAPLREEQVDTVVLGCTHYPFARQWIEQAMGPDVAIIDTAHAVARRVGSLLKPTESTSTPLQDTAIPTPPQLEYWTSGEPAALDAFAQRWLGWSVSSQRLPALASEPCATAANR